MSERLEDHTENMLKVSIAPKYYRNDIKNFIGVCFRVRKVAESSFSVTFESYASFSEVI